MMWYSGGMRGIGGGGPVWSLISIELHSYSVGITLSHGCFPEGLLRLPGVPSCGSTSGRLLLKEALLMHHLCCQINC